MEGVVRTCYRVACYVTCCLENALRNVSMFFRSEPNWEVVEPLRDIGWRFRKQYYLISNKSDPKAVRNILSWVRGCRHSSGFSLMMYCCLYIV